MSISIECIYYFAEVLNIRRLAITLKTVFDCRPVLNDCFEWLSFNFQADVQLSTQFPST